MVLVYSLLIVAPLMIVISLFYIRFTHILETKIRDTSYQTLVETADKIDGVLKLVEQRSEILVKNLEVNRILKN